MPQTLLADTAYGSDANHQKCAKGARWTSPLKPDHEASAAPVVTLVSPTSEPKPAPCCLPCGSMEKLSLLLPIARFQAAFELTVYNRKTHWFTRCFLNATTFRSFLTR